MFMYVIFRVLESIPEFSKTLNKHYGSCFDQSWLFLNIEINMIYERHEAIDFHTYTIIQVGGCSSLLSLISKMNKFIK